jgi:hypothetical protein
MFRGLQESSDGGAILQSGTAQLYIQDSTFDNCYSTANSGGAIAAFGSNLEGLRCCFEECQAKTVGLAIAFKDGIAGKSIGDSNFHHCVNYGGNTETDGLINSAVSLHFHIDRANITETNTRGGAAVRIATTPGRWSLSYCTIFKCRGTTVLNSDVTSGDRSTVYYSN